MRITILLIALLVFVAGCTQQAQETPTVVLDGDEPEAEAPVVEEDEASAPSDSEEAVEADVQESPAAETEEENVKFFEMEAIQWEFIPETITVSEGDTVRLAITSTDVAHGISIPEFGVSERLEVGQTVEVEFVADKKGEFPFFCSVFCGSGHGGMRGSVIVE